MVRLRAGPGVGPLFVAPLFFDNASRRVASRPNSGTACATGGRGPLDRLCRRDAPLATRPRECGSRQAGWLADTGAGRLRLRADGTRRVRSPADTGRRAAAAALASSNDGGPGRWCSCSCRLAGAQRCGSKAETDCFERSHGSVRRPKLVLRSPFSATPPQKPPSCSQALSFCLHSRRAVGISCQAPPKKLRLSFCDSPTAPTQPRPTVSPVSPVFDRRPRTLQ